MSPQAMTFKDGDHEQEDSTAVPDFTRRRCWPSVGRIGRAARQRAAPALKHRYVGIILEQTRILRTGPEDYNLFSIIKI